MRLLKLNISFTATNSPSKPKKKSLPEIDLTNSNNITPVSIVNMFVIMFCLHYTFIIHKIVKFFTENTIIHIHAIKKLNNKLSVIIF